MEGRLFAYCPPWEVPYRRIPGVGLLTYALGIPARNSHSAHTRLSCPESGCAPATGGTCREAPGPCVQKLGNLHAGSSVSRNAPWLRVQDLGSCPSGSGPWSPRSSDSTGQWPQWHLYTPRKQISFPGTAGPTPKMIPVYSLRAPEIKADCLSKFLLQFILKLLLAQSKANNIDVGIIGWVVWPLFM